MFTGLIAAILAAPAPVPSSPYTPEYLARLSACQRAVLAHDPDAAGDDYRAALHANRLDAYRAFVVNHPASPCAKDAADYVAQREAAVARIAAAPKVPLAKAVPTMPLYRFFTTDDYPPAAMRAGEQGRVAVDFDVLPDGYVETCRVRVSSGSASLDAGTCRVIIRRVRYDPARDAAGIPITSTEHTTMTWTIPGPTPPPPPN